MFARVNPLLAMVVALPMAMYSLVAQAGSKSVLETAKEAGQFTTLIQAVEAADLVETLNGVGPFTIFAPTDAAFAKLPQGKLEQLLKPENKDQLASILKHHVLPKRVMAGSIAGKATDLKTVGGGMINVNSAGRMTKVEHAALVQPDIVASNGVIHVIDKVILPQ